MSTQVGTTLAAPIYSPRDTGLVDVFGEQLTRTYRTAWATWRTTAPAIAAAHPDNAAAYLQRISVNRIREAGDIAEVTLYYEELPATRTSERVSETHVDVRLHPSYSALTDANREDIDRLLRDPDAAVTLAGASLELYQKLLSGVTSYIVGTFEVEQTTYSLAEPAGVGASVGTLITPTGYGAGTSYLVVGGSLNQEGAYWARTLIHRYSAAGWDADLY